MRNLDGVADRIAPANVPRYAEGEVLSARPKCSRRLAADVLPAYFRAVLPSKPAMRQNDACVLIGIEALAALRLPVVNRIVTNSSIQTDRMTSLGRLDALDDIA